MMQNLLFMMSLSGTVVFILYLLTYPLAKRCFSLKWRYGILKLSMAFYLLPFSLWKNQIREFICSHFVLLRERFALKPIEVVPEYVIVLNQDTIQMSAKVQYMIVSIVLVGFISLVITGRQIIQYGIIRKRITYAQPDGCGYGKVKNMDMSNSPLSTDKEVQELFLKIKNELKIKRNVKLICSDYCESPITSGVLMPTVMFPAMWTDGMRDVGNCEYMLRHELVHIKHNDVLVKLVCILVMAIHWFNPFVYLLFEEISCISEMYCDGRVMEGKGEEERIKYGELLLTSAAWNEYFNKERFWAGLANSRNRNIYKRRILNMKESRKHRMFLSAAVMLLICMAGGMTAFAYSKPQIFVNETNHDVGTELNFTTKPIEYEKLVSDYFFIADDGTVYNITDINEHNRAFCEHDYSVSGTTQKHKRDGNGGCTLETYEAARCMRCGDIKIIKLISTITYASCPH